MSHPITKVSFLEIWRAPVFWVALGAGFVVAASPTVLPVRFRSPITFAVESAPATSLLWGVFFAALCAIPSSSKLRFAFGSQVLGSPPWRPFGVVLGQGWGQLLAFGLGWVLLLLVQGLGVWLLPWWRPGVVVGDGAWGALFFGSLLGAFQGVTLVALARVVGACLKFAPATLIFLALLFATQFLATTLNQPLDGQEDLAGWQLGLGPIFPGLDLMRSARVGWRFLVAAGLSSALYWLVSNLILVLILERRRGGLTPLDEAANQT